MKLDLTKARAKLAQDRADNAAAYEALRAKEKTVCSRCGRALKTPESVARGVGPECAELLFNEALKEDTHA